MNSIASLKDKVSAGIAQDPVEVSFLKATNHKEKPPKEKHVNILISSISQYSSSGNVGLIVRLLRKRLSEQKDWLATMKCFILLHRLINVGVEDLLQQLIKTSHVFNMFNFMDSKSPEGHSASMFIRSYANFLAEKVYFARDVSWNVSLGLYASGKITMSSDKLLDTMDIFEKFFKILFELEIPRSGVNHPVIRAASILVMKDSLTAFTSYSNLLIEVLERFFTMDKLHAQRALRKYKQCIENTASMKKLLDYCAVIAGDFRSFPPLVDVPTSLLEACENYVKELEATRPRGNSAAYVPKINERPPEEKQTGVGNVRETQYHPSASNAPALSATKTSSIMDDFLLLDIAGPAPTQQAGNTSQAQSKAAPQYTASQPTYASGAPPATVDFFDPFAEFSSTPAITPAVRSSSMSATHTPALAPPPMSSSTRPLQPPTHVPYIQPSHATTQSFASRPQPTQPSLSASTSSAYFDPFADPTPTHPAGYHPQPSAIPAMIPQSLGTNSSSFQQPQSYDTKAAQIRTMNSFMGPSSPIPPTTNSTSINLESLLSEMKSTKGSK
eukprot:TRINITY_DN4476_c0_g1_i1.p1 TRINITY_DN4476_c0_g1~~TRINITY_DN4476_c0_g1_i1.p1  ORF type:complete len:557 (+),score=107.14 TRINITY_DN4476_c0_g1_i1:48-1718(+)